MANINLQEEREWWKMRIKHPFVGDLQKQLDEFQEKLIAAGEPIIFIPQQESRSLCMDILGFG